MTATVYVRSIMPGTGKNNSNEFSGVGHAWIEVHHPGGTVDSFGYYPFPVAYTAPGVLRTTDAQD